MYVYTVFDALIYSHLNIHKCIFLHTKSTVSTNCHPCSLCSVLRVINKKFANTISSIDGQTDRQTHRWTDALRSAVSHSVIHFIAIIMVDKSVGYSSTSKHITSSPHHYTTISSSATITSYPRIDGIAF